MLRAVAAPSTELREAIARARAARPEITVDDASLTAWLVERANATTPLSDLRVGDLLLTCACAQGDTAAIAAFHHAFDAGIRAALHRSGARAPDPDELRQGLDVHLFVARPDGSVRIAEYRGVGSLQTWVRVVATRLALNAGRRRVHDHLTEQIERELGDAGDLELEWLKARYRAAFRTALTAVLAELPDRDRSLLRLCVRDGLSATGVAAIHKVHRATAKRWLARIRQDVLEATRLRLRAALGVEPEELDQIMQLIGSRLDASVHRCLATRGGDAG
jgi:RNA polymerase sigma-70 factor (ECF subfamily)